MALNSCLAPQSAAELIDYMYSPAGSTPLARLRASDGHVPPYTPRVVIELGNEEPADNGEYAKAALPILSAMRAKLAEIGGPPVAGVRFAIAYTYVFGTGEFAATQARVLTHPLSLELVWIRTDLDWQAEILDATAPFAESMVWDQHTWPMTDWTEPAGYFAMYANMTATLRAHGWGQRRPIFVGETNCGESFEACTSMRRALIYGTYVAQALRLRPRCATPCSGCCPVVVN